MAEYAGREELLAALSEGKESGVLTQVEMKNCDLSGIDFSKVDCSWWALYNCTLDGCDFTDGAIAHGRFENCSFRNARFVRCNMTGADLRGADLTDADIRGAELLSAWL